MFQGGYTPFRQRSWKSVIASILKFRYTQDNIMRLSWSHKVFLRINRFVGSRPWVDRLMLFCGHWLIYAIYGAVTIWVLRRLVAGQEEGMLVVLGGLKAALLALAISYGIGWIWPHRRPIREFPQIKELIRPLGTWKAFPSDHTIAATLPPVLIAVVGGPLWFVASLALAGLGVALGRVYIGVHYPRDIIGGLVVACLSLWIVIHYG